MSRSINKRVKEIVAVLEARDANSNRLEKWLERQKRFNELNEEFAARLEEHPGNYLFAVSGPAHRAMPEKRENLIEYLSDPGYVAIFDEAIENYTQMYEARDAKKEVSDDGAV